MQSRLKKILVYPIPMFVTTAIVLYLGMVLEATDFSWEIVRLAGVAIILSLFVNQYSAFLAGIGKVASDTERPFAALRSGVTYRVIMRGVGHDKSLVLIVEDPDKTGNWTVRVPKDLVVPQYFRVVGPAKIEPIYDRIICLDREAYDFERAREVTYPTVL